MLIRIDLRPIPKNDRTAVWLKLFEQYTRALETNFPEAAGYRHDGSGKPTTWQVSRGRYWGLIFQVKPQNWKWERLDIGISGFFPAFGVPSTPANRFEKALENLPPVLKFAAHRLGVVMLAVYVAVILPLTVIYRLALLKLQPSIQSAYGYLEAVWPQIQASYPGLLNLQRRRSPAAMFALGAVAAVGVACVCFVILSDPSREWSTLHFLSGIAGVLAALTLIILSVQRLLTSDTGL